MVRSGGACKPKQLRIVVLLDGVAGAGVACVMIYSYYENILRTVLMYCLR